MPVLRSSVEGKHFEIITSKRLDKKNTVTAFSFFQISPLASSDGLIIVDRTLHRFYLKLSFFKILFSNLFLFNFKLTSITNFAHDL